MPGRVSARASAAGRPSHKPSPPPVDSIEDTTVAESACTVLRKQICSVFADTQKTTAGHRKLVVNLRKIQEKCCYESSQTKDGKSTDEFNEEEFNAEIARCVLRILMIKKSESAGERTIKFLGQFLKHASDKGMPMFYSRSAVC